MFVDFKIDLEIDPELMDLKTTEFRTDNIVKCRLATFGYRVAIGPGESELILDITSIASKGFD